MKASDKTPRPEAVSGGIADFVPTTTGNDLHDSFRYALYCQMRVPLESATRLVGDIVREFSPPPLTCDECGIDVRKPFDTPSGRKICAGCVWDKLKNK